MMYSPKISNGDEVRLSNNRGYESISGKDKVRQDLAMIFTTDIRDTTGLGGQLDDVIGEDAENPATAYSVTPLMFEFQMRVKSAVDRLKKAQRKYQYSYRVPSELIHDFTEARIWPIIDDPRNYRWEIGIQTMDGVSSTLKGGMKV